jgi:hypothetical protein
MRKITFLFTLIVIVFFISGCKKDEKNIDERIVLLTAKNWKMSAFTIDGVNSFNEYYDECETDNIETFELNGNYIVHEGATKCFDDDNDVYEEGKWELKGNEITFTLGGSSLAIKCTLLELTSNTLKYSVINPFDQSLFVITFTGVTKLND